MAPQSCCTARFAQRSSIRQQQSLSSRYHGQFVVSAYKEQRFDSLIPEVITDMETNVEYQEMIRRTAEKGQAALTRDENAKRQAVLSELDIVPWEQKMKDAGVSPLVRSQATILQLNIGLYCNQACSHCHVESSPKRTEMMDRGTAERCVELLKASPSITTLDITGGAPELNSEFKYLVEAASALDVEIIDRCNLTVLCEPGQEYLAQFLADNKVRVVASLPCYTAENVDSQRGGGTFRRSIVGLQRLNAVGYGVEGSGLSLDLIYNPGGAFLAPDQSALEPAYKQELAEAYGISFNSLLCLNNMPIKRFWDYLEKQGAMQDYMKLLEDSFNPVAGEKLMCRDTVSVAWDGSIYDCDFNQQLAMSAAGGLNGAAADVKPTVHNIHSLNDLTERRIACGNHCYGCTAGSGSSCQGQ